jgi:hypothetical protein
VAAVILVTAACRDGEAGPADRGPADTRTTAIPTTPRDHEGRTQCLVCHAEEDGLAPTVPGSPDHSGFADDPAVCLACHLQEE